MHHTQVAFDFAVFCGYATAFWVAGYYIHKGVRWVFTPRTKPRGATRVR